MAPDFAQFEREYAGKIGIVAANVDKPETRDKYGQFKGSQYIPETVVLRNGKVVARYDGAMSVDALKKAVADALK